MEREILFTLRGDVSRSVVAEELNITPQMLGAIERGDRTPSLTLAKKIADYYGKSVDEIFFEQNGNEMCPNKNTA
ncbi:MULTISPECIES: helix-turn-helix transcriptional regulator [Bacillus subtilis group]|uniref:helix-turn-helix transcriptional regulator n=1 Tax=Bacillus subtilis group TaxID=653685 RepID=UPI0022832A41|nr:MULTISPECIES: helix-turn-helix transcriptional regulator [Bacillus subtilis group]MCY8022050.1 helix-turn-helix transcriptional regulator [Bacillus licheniformis]MCY9267881.1 helix-turn-helix transcriptional regulator [Bacillus licheniformis]MED1190460.1 helix-turn-helix transcriptional regulator [Bacillus paralicheniformis]